MKPTRTTTTGTLGNNKTLKEKALQCAVLDIKQAEDRTQANARYIKWEVFHKEPLFMQAIKEKQQSLKT